MVEVWAVEAQRRGRPRVTVCVNRTPAPSEFSLQRAANPKTDYWLTGGGIENTFKVGRARDLDFLVNVQTPFIPLTSTGKDPDLMPVESQLLLAMANAASSCARRIRSNQTNDARVSRKSTILANLDAAIEHVRGSDRNYRYSLRQLYYAVRPHLIAAFDEEPNYNHFASVISAHEAEQGHDLPGIFRDTRGTLYHPHLSQWINLGTREVEKYDRPAWMFNKILYCEKEGFFPMLIKARWPERHDCALLTSKGFASKAARDVMDLLSDTDEPIQFFCIHDADGPGTLIYQALGEATASRAARKAEVVNLGLEPAEARKMKLAVEAVQRKSGNVSVARYVSDQEEEWLQGNRVELNAMTTPQFLAWLDAKMEPYVGKVIPPANVIGDRLEQELKAAVRQRTIERILCDAGLEEQVDAELALLGPALESRRAGLMAHIQARLASEPCQAWWFPIGDVVGEVMGG